MSNPSALWFFESVDLYDILCPHKVKLKEQNLINFDRKKILILDLDKLR